jgi:hypothetical protein
VLLELIDRYSAPVFFALLGLDLIIRLGGLARKHVASDSLCSVTMGALYALVSSGVRGGVLIAFAALHEYAPFDIGTDEAEIDRRLEEIARK